VGSQQLNRLHKINQEGRMKETTNQPKEDEGK